jgi:hypothetical protein
MDRYAVGLFGDGFVVVVVSRSKVPVSSNCDSLVFGSMMVLVARLI